MDADLCVQQRKQYPLEYQRTQGESEILDAEIHVLIDELQLPTEKGICRVCQKPSIQRWSATKRNAMLGVFPSLLAYHIEMSKLTASVAILPPVCVFRCSWMLLDPLERMSSSLAGVTGPHGSKQNTGSAGTHFYMAGKGAF